jgi:hypothetical protein
LKSTTPTTIANAIWTSASAIRAIHLPRTIDPGVMGVDARRRRSPCSRSITSVIAPLVSSTSIVNMTSVPGTACANPIGGSIRRPAGFTVSDNVRGMAPIPANASADAACPFIVTTARSARTS